MAEIAEGGGGGHKGGKKTRQEAVHANRHDANGRLSVPVINVFRFNSNF